MKFGVVINPASRRGKGAEDGILVSTSLAARGVEMVDLSGTNAREALVRAREAVASRKIDALVVVGGDGTVNIGVEATAQTRIPLGIVASGTGNDVARHLGLPMLDVEASLDRILSSYASGHWRTMDAFEVTSELGTRRAASVLAGGLDADVNARTNSFSWPKGGLRYVRGILAGLIHFRPYDLRIVADGEVIDGPVTLISVANTGYIGAGIRIAPMANEADGLLDVIIASGMTRRRIGAILPALARARHLDMPEVRHLRAAKVRLESVGHAPNPMADGEPIGILPVTVECLPAALEILA